MAFDLLVAVGVAEDDEKDDRQQEREERELATADVEEELTTQLVEQERHSVRSWVSER